MWKWLENYKKKKKKKKGVSIFLSRKYFLRKLLFEGKKVMFIGQKCRYLYGLLY